MTDLPQEPTYEMLKALAGDPVILAASDEEELRKRYAAMIRVMQSDANRNLSRGLPDNRKLEQP